MGFWAFLVFWAFNLLFFFFFGLILRVEGQNVPKNMEKKGQINYSPRTWLKQHCPDLLIQIQMKNLKRQISNLYI
jgi:hypothetical protein